MTDIAGNVYTYNNGNDLLTQNGTSFSYDANGNMTSKTDSSGTTTYQYDSENRLVEFRTPNAQLVTYKYDPFGRRIEKNVNGVITRYVYDREDILFELDGSGNIITEYVHGPGIDEPIAMRRNNQTYYYHADGLGSVIAITDSGGNVVQRYEYNSFGEITYVQDPNFKQPYTYTGREWDEESGLYYYRARYYDAKVGRFLQQDPFRGNLGKPQSLNLYPYTQNNPATYTDPSGKWVAPVIGGVAAVGGLLLFLDCIQRLTGENIGGSGGYCPADSPVTDSSDSENPEPTKMPWQEAAQICINFPFLTKFIYEPFGATGETIGEHVGEAVSH